MQVNLTEVQPLTSLGLTHRRFGHVGVDSLKFMSTCECYTKRGFVVKSADFGKEYCKCDVCALVKMKKTRNHALADRYEYKQGQFYYVDYSGPFEVSRQGNHYMVLFVDRHTRLIIGFFVKKKDEATAIEIIKKFIKENLAAPKFTE